MENEDTSDIEAFVERYLPSDTDRPHITVTWAQSIDARISAGRGLRTKLSSPYSMKMTHYLRTRHAAILVGWQTVIADNPRLNCRYKAGVDSPVPVIVDPQFSWNVHEGTWAVLESAKAGTGKPPIVIVQKDAVQINDHTAEKSLFAKYEAIERVGGSIVSVNNREWSSIMNALERQGLHSVMIEGGAGILESVLKSKLPASVIITVAPVFLGSRGVLATTTDRLELENVDWWSDNSQSPDSVLCASLASNPNKN